MEKSKESEDTYVPSKRLDSGITRSRVWGSTAIPAVVFGGLMGGRDIRESNQQADFKFQSSRVTVSFILVTDPLTKCDMPSSSQAQQALENLHLVVLLSTTFTYQSGLHTL
jgi:hypothetical protein